MPGRQHSPWCGPWQCERIPRGYFGYFSGQRVKIKFGNVEDGRDQMTSWHEEPRVLLAQVSLPYTVL